MTLPTLLNLSNIVVVDVLKRNLHSKSVEKEAEHICQSLGIYRENLRDYNTMSGYLFPTTSPEKLLAITLFNNLLFYIDDCLDRNDTHTPSQTERLKRFQRLIDTFRTGNVQDKSDILENATAYIRNILYPLAEERWFYRFIKNTRSHLDATTYNATDALTTGREVLFNQFIELRQHDSGMVPTVDLIEFASGFYLPDYVHEDPFIVQLKSEVTLASALMNDIFSYHREVIVQGSNFNLIAVVEKAYQLPFEPSLDYSVRYINHIIQSFLDKEKHLPIYGEIYLDSHLKGYYTALKDQINAAWHWQLSGTNRYRSAHSPFEQLREPLLEI